jgi:hypothetical protein
LSNGSCGTHRFVALNGRIVLFVNPVVTRGMYVIFRSDFGLSVTVQGGDNNSPSSCEGNVLLSCSFTNLILYYSDSTPTDCPILQDA